MDKEKLIDLIKNNRLSKKQEEKLEEMFLEVRESEDERIRKGLINFFNDFRLPTFGGLEPKKILAWLEKQGKHNVYKEPFNEGYKLGYREASENIAEEPEKYDLQKQGEQKPVKWSEEDKRMHQYVFNELMFVKELVNDPNYAIYVERVEKEIDWFKSLKERYTWKPSDEQINALDSAVQYGIVSHNSFEHLNSLFNDLNKLKEG